ncbi:hypothetical protein WJX81_006306 [Elliptochloris bilobata]|uniref:Uncharacterized protein n=1 Tax=Elliptochloris bilobata TaxID=381761 RepID=A0AAW1RD34_9CHLO
MDDSRAQPEDHVRTRTGNTSASAQSEYVRAEIDREANGASVPFDAAQYSFFGGPDAVGGDALEGGLEEGVDAPPEEELPLEEGELEGEPLYDVEPDGTGDLSYAAMFASTLLSKMALGEGGGAHGETGRARDLDAADPQVAAPNAFRRGFIHGSLEQPRQLVHLGGSALSDGLGIGSGLGPALSPYPGDAIWAGGPEGTPPPPPPPKMPPFQQGARPPPQQGGRGGSGADGALLARRRMYGSWHMDAEEIESILRIQWKSLHSGSPYQEDFYYQAYAFKHRGGRNARWFAPEGLRELPPAERIGAGAATYVALEGLGKVAHANIRRPKPLMDVANAPRPDASAGPGSEAGNTALEGAAQEQKPRRALEDEPLLAARIVVEDCLCLLLDVDDIDRLPPGAGDEAALRSRRALLMEAVASSLRLAGEPAPADRGSADAVFGRLMALHKGRALLARTLRVRPGARVGAGPGGTVGGPEAMADATVTELGATAQLAASASKVLRRLETPGAICGCGAALAAGDLAAPLGGPAAASPAAALLPMFAAGDRSGGHRAWLADVLAALLLSAQDAGLAEYASERRAMEEEGPHAAEGRAWHGAFDTLYGPLERHMATLLEVYRAAQAAGAQEAAEYARAIVPVDLIRAVLPHLTELRRERLRDTLNVLLN